MLVIVVSHTLWFGHLKLTLLCRTREWLISLLGIDDSVFYQSNVKAEVAASFTGCSFPTKFTVYILTFDIYGDITLRLVVRSDVELSKSFTDVFFRGFPY